MAELGYNSKRAIVDNLGTIAMSKLDDVAAADRMTRWLEMKSAIEDLPKLGEEGLVELSQIASSAPEEIARLWASSTLSANLAQAGPRRVALSP